jgi:hypothetical protein
MEMYSMVVRFATHNRFGDGWLPGQVEPSWGGGSGWYVPRALGEIGTSAAAPRVRAPARRGTWVALVAAGAAISACGGGTRQDANEPTGKFPVKVTRASFPNRQHISRRTDLVLGVQNAGSKPLPSLAVTIWTGDTKANGSFSVRLDQPNLANPSRPVWILENLYPKLLGNGVTLANVEKAPSAGAEVAQTDTFDFGRVKPGKTRVMDWRVTPAMTGTYTVHYAIAAGLQGNAKAVTPAGSPVRGEFVVTVGSKPPQTCVLPNGQVISGKCVLTPSGAVTSGGGNGGK